MTDKTMQALCVEGGQEGKGAWRTDSPTFGKRPMCQYVWLQGSCNHSGLNWFRSGWGIAGIRRTGDTADGLFGYRRSDIERICRDNDIDLHSARVVGWLPATPPAPLNEDYRPSLLPCDDGEWAIHAEAATPPNEPQTGEAGHG